MVVSTPSLGKPLEDKPFLGPQTNVEAVLKSLESDLGFHRHTAHRVEDLPAPDPMTPLPSYGRLSRDLAPKPKPFAVDAVFMSNARMRGYDTYVRMSQVGFNYQARFPIRERGFFTIRPLADILFLDGPGDPFVLPAQLYKVAFDFQTDFQFNDQLGLSVGTTPGLWTDFVKLENDAFRMPFRVLGTIRAADNIFFAGGILYTDNIRRNLFPAGGVIWEASDKLRIELLFPRTRFVYKVFDFLEVYFVGEGYGGTWSIRTNIAGNLYNDEVLYHDYRLMFGTQVDYFQRVSLFVELGGVVDRRFVFSNLLQPNTNVNDAFILRCGVRF